MNRSRLISILFLSVLSNMSGLFANWRAELGIAPVSKQRWHPTTAGISAAQGPRRSAPVSEERSASHRNAKDDGESREAETVDDEALTGGFPKFSDFIEYFDRDEGLGRLIFRQLDKVGERKSFPRILKRSKAKWFRDKWEKVSDLTFKKAIRDTVDTAVFYKEDEQEDFKHHRTVVELVKPDFQYIAETMGNDGHLAIRRLFGRTFKSSTKKSAKWFLSRWDDMPWKKGISIKPLIKQIIALDRLVSSQSVRHEYDEKSKEARTGDREESSSLYRRLRRA